MTGWAATNTLRANAQHFLEGPGALISGAELHHSEECPGCKQDAALALVEAALDAAADPGLFDVFDDNRRYAAEKRLAAALRAVREGA